MKLSLSFLSLVSFSFFLVLLFSFFFVPFVSADLTGTTNLTTSGNILNYKSFSITPMLNLSMNLTNFDWIINQDTKEFYPRNNIAFPSGKIPEFVYLVNKLQTDEVCSGNQYYQYCSKEVIDFSTFETKNNITNKTITPVNKEIPLTTWERIKYFFLDLLGKPPILTKETIGYLISYEGVIRNLDPSFNQTYSSTTSGFFNQTNATHLGVSLTPIWNSSLGYKDTIGNYSSFVFYNTTSTYWNATFGMVDSNGSWKNYNICNNDANCVGYWALDEAVQSTTFVDSKAGHNAFCSGTTCPNITSGLSSRAEAFDGSNDIINVTDSTSLNLTYNISVSVWIKSSYTANYQMVVSKPNVAATLGYGLYIQLTSGKVAFNIYTTGHDLQTVSTNAVTDGNWHHAVGIYNDTTISIYIDGVLAGTPIADTFGAGSNTGNLGIGGSPLGTLYPFKGSIDEVLIYNKSLSVNEVTSLYKAGLSQHSVTNVTLFTRTATNYNTSDNNLVLLWGLNNDSSLGENSTKFVDSKLGEYNATCSGTACPIWSYSNGTVGGGLEFDGSNDVVIGVKDILNNTNTTYSFWMKSANQPAQSVLGAVVMKVSDYGDVIGFGDAGHVNNPSSGVTKIGMKVLNSGVAWYGTNVECSSVVTDGKWHYVVFVRNGSSAYCYLDGIKDGTIGNYGTASQNIRNFSLGAVSQDLSAYALFYKGAIDEFRIYNRSLSATEISDLYQLGTTHVLWGNNGAWTKESVISDNVVKTSTSLGSFFQFKLELNSNDTISSPFILNHSISITDKSSGEVDLVYPIFYNYWDDNATLTYNGTGSFNVTINNTNGTVILNINGSHILASNLTENVYNVSYYFSINGNYLYNWTAYGNGTSHNLNTSNNFYYFINPDTTPPNITYTPDNTTIELNTTSLKVNYTATDDFPFSFLLNDTANFIINDSGFLQNKTSLKIGTYNVQITINDSSSNNATAYFTLWVNDTIPPDFTTIPANATILYEDSLSELFEATDLSGGVTFFINYTSLFAINSGWLEDSEVAGVGVYNINVSVNDSSNNINSTIYKVTINKAPQTFNALLNGFNNNLSTIYKDYFNASVSGLNKTSVLIQMDVINLTYNQNYIYAVGHYVINYSAPTNQNYTAYNAYLNLTINKSNPSNGLNITGTTPIFYETTSDFLYSENNTGDDGCAYSMTPSNIIFGADVSPVTFNYSTSGCANYSAGSITKDLIINKKAPNLGFNVTPNWNVLEGTETTVNGLNCPTQLSALGLCLLHRNDALVSNPDVNILPTGTYTYIYNTTGNANYSVYSISSPLLISGVPFAGGSCPEGTYMSSVVNGTVQCNPFNNSLLNQTCPNGFFSMGYYMNGTIKCGQEVDPIWTSNWTFLVNLFCGDDYKMIGIYLNGTIKCVRETDPVWTSNWTNMVSTCPNGYAQEGFWTNGTIKCRVLPINLNETCQNGFAQDGHYDNGSIRCRILPINLNETCSIGYAMNGHYDNGSLRCDFNELDPYWTSNWTNMHQTCPTNYSVSGFWDNGTIKCNYINWSSGAATAVQTIQTCRYKRYGYYNLKLPFYGERGCV